ncbi:hypothetical protein ACH4RG_23300 [Streptomyces sp. NPDC021019]|uniref:RapZ C-terminal domain-containing protein n=1 Tax=Streptomyces sp. NPDC021019 TaxID=3365108 RepID=UPI0037A5661E
MTAAPLIRVISFGYGHTGLLDDDGHNVLEPPTADVTLDLRRVLYNPHQDPAMRHLTGLDDTVHAHVLATPGARILALNTAMAAHTLMHQAHPPVVTVAAGCAGGRHRAVSMARAVLDFLTDMSAGGGYRTELVHRDAHRPVLPSSAHR